MQTLKPIYDHFSYSKDIERLIYSQFYYSIFKPLLEILDSPSSRDNASTTALKQALASGKIRYQGGYFIGSLTAKLSKELRGIGASYNKLKKAYFLELSHLPQDLKLAIRAAKEVEREKLKKVEEYLASIEGRKLTPLELEPFFGETISKLDKQFHSTTKVVTGRDLEIPMTPYQKERLKDAYTDNLNMYIQDWHDQEVLKLRKLVTKNTSEGFRAENLIGTIQAQKGVSQRKAKFLARQETSLMVSKYRQIRYEEVGLKKYQWSTSHDVRVRHDHRELQGRIFSYDNPPITDKATGARNNPGEDFNCRCVAIPILTTREVLESDYATR